jgi:hypothetical protein
VDLGVRRRRDEGTPGLEAEDHDRRASRTL